MSQPISDDLDIQAHPLGHLPLVAGVLDDLGVTAVLSEHCPMDPRSKVSDADCVVAMVLNILGGRTALYRMEQWTRKLPVDVLIGPHCSPEDFSDARLARALDHLFKAGTDKLLTAVVKKYLSREDRDRSYTLHQDSTSLSLHGAYEGETPDWVPKPAFGFSKDHRPDLKQLVFGLTLHGTAGIPFVATMFDGNTSDKFMNGFHIESLVDLLPDEDEVTLVADSKLVDKQLLGALLDQGMHFISLVPRSWKVREHALEMLAAEADGDHPELGRTAARRKADPDTRYRGRSYTLDFEVRRPGPGTEETVPMRFLAIHSEALASKFEASLPGKLTKDAETFRAAIAGANRKPFSCADDAEEALIRLKKKLRLHRSEGAAVERYEVPGKRPRGRPAKDAPEPPPEIRYRLLAGDVAVNDEAVDQIRRSKSHLVLITDHLDSESHSDQGILADYRHQHLVEGHNGFRWLKGPAQVSPLFLKTPKRIAALGLVLMFALMVRNYVQFTVRKKLAENAEKLPYYDRKRETSTPTAEVIWELFSDLVLIVLTVPGAAVIRRLQGSSEAQTRVLNMLGLEEAALMGRINAKGGSG